MEKINELGTKKENFFKLNSGDQIYTDYRFDLPGISQDTKLTIKSVRRKLGYVTIKEIPGSVVYWDEITYIIPKRNWMRKWVTR